MGHGIDICINTEGALSHHFGALKMSANRVVQAIRPHIPLIKFRAGGSARKVITPVTVLATPPPPPPCPITSAKANTDVVPPAAITSTLQPSSSSSLKPPSTRRSDAPEFFMLHPKYHRAALTQEEIDFINRGGPD